MRTRLLQIVYLYKQGVTLFSFNLLWLFNKIYFISLVWATKLPGIINKTTMLIQSSLYVCPMQVIFCVLTLLIFSPVFHIDQIDAVVKGFWNCFSQNLDHLLCCLCRKIFHAKDSIFLVLSCRLLFWAMFHSYYPWFQCRSFGSSMYLSSPSISLYCQKRWLLVIRQYLFIVLPWLNLVFVLFSPPFQASFLFLA